MDTNKIHCGECSEVLSRFPDNSINLTVTSPPYDKLRDYNGYAFDFVPIAKELYRVTVSGGVVTWVVGDATLKGSETGTSFRQALGFMDCGFNLHDTMIYKSKSKPLSHNRYEQEFQYMFVFSKPGAKVICNHIRKACESAMRNYTRRKSSRHRNTNGDFETRDSTWITKKSKIIGNIWQYDTGGGNEDKIAHKHPAPFPEALARDHVISWSNPNDIVLDCFCGSGTTLKMAKELGRQWVGIDISQEYCDLSQRRVDLARVPLFVY